MSALPWFKCNPRDLLDGLLDLESEEQGPYMSVLSLIYIRGGAIPDDARWLAGNCRLSVRRWNIVRASLIAKGKLFVSTNGGLMNDRAAKELGCSEDNPTIISGSPRDNIEAPEAKANENKALLPLDIDIDRDKEKKDREAIASLVRNLGIAIAAGVDEIKAAKAKAEEAFNGRFRAFWAAYPRRVKKPDALKAYKNAEAKIGENALQVILEGIERALPGWDDVRFVPHPATWLNACQWEDEAPPPRIERSRHDRPDHRTAKSDHLSAVARAMAAACDGAEGERRPDRANPGFDEPMLIGHATA